MSIKHYFTFAIFKVVLFALCRSSSGNCAETETSNKQVWLNCHERIVHEQEVVGTEPRPLHRLLS